MSNPSGWLPNLIGPVTWQVGGVDQTPRGTINFGGDSTAVDDEASDTLTITVSSRLPFTTYASSGTYTGPTEASILTLPGTDGIWHVKATVLFGNAGHTKGGVMVATACWRRASGVATLVRSSAASLSSDGSAYLVDLSSTEKDADLYVKLVSSDVVVRLIPSSSGALVYSLSAEVRSL